MPINIEFLGLHLDKPDSYYKLLNLSTIDPKTWNVVSPP